MDRIESGVRLDFQQEKSWPSARDGVAGKGFIVLTREIYLAELRVSWFREKKLLSPSLKIIKNHELFELEHRKPWQWAYKTHSKIRKKVSQTYFQLGEDKINNYP